MFIPTMLKDSPGLQAELCVWDAVTKAFDEKTSLAVHHYPMFFSNASRRREIDILIVDNILGVCVIEVKGIKIDQITAIQGHQWSYTNFYETQGSPFQQAEKQLNMLCQHLETNPLLYRRLSKRVFIALPYISEQQWRERGFDKQIHVPLPLFKEDFADRQRLLKKLQTFALSEARGRMTKLELAKISQMLGIQSTNTHSVVLDSYLPFSHLYVIQTRVDFDCYKRDISDALSRGTKVYILTYTDLQIIDLEGYEEYMKAFQLNVYRGEQSVQNPINSGYFIDGKNIKESLLEIMAEHFPSFNSGQYKVIHQPIEAHQIITAGAGTGKTHVMIDRVLFLLMTGGISLKLIIMITFTNASTTEMKKRLEEKFIMLFNLTSNSQFLLFAEEVKGMKISTIHSFARSILKQLAHEIGYGQNIQMRSFKFEKKRIVYELLNEFFSIRSVEQFLSTKLKDYEFVDFVCELWEEMEKKGLTSEETERIDWGIVSGEKATVIHEMLRYIFKHCEARLDSLKYEENAITMGDLIRKLKVFTKSRNKMIQLSKDHFIFVDEFQDSDAIQIELLASLQKFLQYRLFVVGDIKQAIYRFRGADYKSFQELQDMTKGVAYTQTELQLNYRSSASLLDKMHPLFECWHKQGWLTYGKTDRLMSNEASQFPNKDWHVSASFEEDLKKALETLPEKQDKIALIVRTNHHAKRIKEYCISNNISTSENLDGTFFKSMPVLHLKTLVEALLYSNEPKFVLNALQTPYFGCVIPYSTLVPFGGNKGRIMSFIHACTNNDFKQYVLSLRTLAPMTVIQKIIFDKQLFIRLPDYMEKKLLEENEEKRCSKEAIELAVLRYEKNLQHLMTLIERNFPSQHVTLQMLRDWLQLQISTNRTENEPILNQSAAQVEITTVHRSKGLEYHTVFLPITNSPFNAVGQQYFLEEKSEQTDKEKVKKLGWKVKVEVERDSVEYENNHFQVLKAYEDYEQFKEETRLLYVALTRAKQRVYITIPKKIFGECWAKILIRGGLLDRLEALK
ncbi:hypothetical protein B4147_1089 [Bacillus wiedmannii]|uniref:DNA 3'-5' helicase n=1 Tax=Bacillus wiedmannii TaxID=1890302 RepID=A0A0G8CQV6_9BACI|nr:UvrD-helicase domain-containing protein [Bacillus wiedmannii]KLA01422.1 hypothetical protein B4147_1089 [Bacillus wiedmannii]